MYSDRVKKGYHVIVLLGNGPSLVGLDCDLSANTDICSDSSPLRSPSIANTASFKSLRLSGLILSPPSTFTLPPSTRTVAINTSLTIYQSYYKIDTPQTITGSHFSLCLCYNIAMEVKKPRSETPKEKSSFKKHLAAIVLIVAASVIAAVFIVAVNSVKYDEKYHKRKRVRAPNRRL